MGQRGRNCILPKMKWRAVSALHFNIVRPSDSRTTLKPNDTTRSIKNDMELRPASRIATWNPKISYENLKTCIVDFLTDNEKYGRSRALAVRIKISVISCKLI